MTTHIRSFAVLRTVGVVCVAMLCVRPAPAAAQAVWHLTPEVRIGGPDKGKEYEFTQIDAVVPGPNGMLFVSEFQPPDLRVFDAAGKYVRTIGRVGSGPGEFRMLPNIGFIGDTLWTVDGELRRVSLFAADGRLVTTIPQTPVEPAKSAAPSYLTRADIWVVVSGDRAIGVASYSLSAQADGKVPVRPIYRLTRGGRMVDTIAWMSTLHSQLSFLTGTGGMFLMQTFSDTPLWVVASQVERVFIVDRSAATSARDATFGVIALRISGDTAWSRRYPYTPKPLEAASADSALSKSVSFGGMTVTREQLRAKLFLPAFRPPIASVVAAADGSVWLRREDAPTKGGDVDYTVIGPNGNLLATVTIKRSASIKAVSGNLVWTVETDEDDVPSIVRYRITR